MRILHTSDWHLGQFFINKSRAQEHQKFITWLLEQVLENDVDAVIIAGDVFDTGSPPSYARELYNQFVIGMNKLGRQLIILAGNHDSVSTLNESKNILAHLNTQVIAAASEDLTSQVLTLKSKGGEVGAIVCAIPYLRPRDIIQSRSGQSGEQKQQALGQAISQHYNDIFALAEKQRDALYNSFPNKRVPIIATGHLTAMGVTTSDSVRDIYIGSLEAFPAKDFPAADYIALGHIHRPQRVAKTDHIRYCGSPIPLSFDELGSDSIHSKKEVLLVDFKDGALNSVEPLSVPLFQPMQVIKGDLKSIEKQLAQFTVDDIADSEDSPLPTWLSIEVDTQDYLNDLQQRIQALTMDMNVEILQLRRARKQHQQRIEREDKELLAELTPQDVFERRLACEIFETDNEKERLSRLKTAFTNIVDELEAELNDED